MNRRMFGWLSDANSFTSLRASESVALDSGTIFKQTSLLGEGVGACEWEEKCGS